PALGCLIPLSRNTDLWRSSLSACESQYPAEIHDQIQSENVGIKSLGILDAFRRNVRYDAFYRHAASHTSIRLRHAPKHCVRRSANGRRRGTDQVRRLK